MKEEIKKNLDSLKKELDKLAPAIEHLQIADKNATALVNSFKSIHSIYELHLLSIEELLVASNKEHLNQIAKELNASSSKLNSLGDTVSNSFKGLEKDVTSFLDNHKSLATETGNLTSKIDNIDFPKRLDSIEKTIKETIAILNNTRESTLEELKKASEIITKADFDGRFKKLQNSIDSSVKSNEELSNSIEKQKLPDKIDGFEKNITKKLETSISELQKNTKLISTETTKSIHDLNIPIRIDKLDATISSINQGIQTIQQRLGDLERNIKDDVLSKQKELIAKIESAENATKQRIDNSEKEFTKMFEKVSKENNLLKILLFVSIGLTAGLIIYRIISGT